MFLVWLKLLEFHSPRKKLRNFAPKIRQVIDWFGQLKAVDLQSIEPAIRADTEGDNLRGDVPEKFENREALISAVPYFEKPYIKVPKAFLTACLAEDFEKLRSDSGYSIGSELAFRLIWLCEMQKRGSVG
ncbi:hypothetical protein HAX54_005627 [Datura stramonium]|uniref:Asparagine synthetase domain-containing protein n=1 Tax=Datura stramonium TaxID=4076 RepID=A0ABS8T938_DATST|nr:hypothetical protein [Datura stramonium]